MDGFWRRRRGSRPSFTGFPEEKDSMKRLISGSRLRQSAHVRAAALLIAGFALFAAAAASAAPQADWPSFKEQTEKDHVLPGSNLEKLIAENQDFGLLRPEEAKDSLRIPLWLRVLWHKN